MNEQNINKYNITKITLNINDYNDPILFDIIFFLEEYHYIHLCRDGSRKCGCSSRDMIESAAYHFGILEKIQELEWKKYNNDNVNNNKDNDNKNNNDENDNDTLSLINLIKNSIMT